MRSVQLRFLLLLLGAAVLVVLSGLVIQVLAAPIDWLFCWLEKEKPAIPCTNVDAGIWRFAAAVLAFGLVVVLIYILSREVVERTEVRAEGEAQLPVADTLVVPLSPIDDQADDDAETIHPCFQEMHRARLVSALWPPPPDPAALETLNPRLARSDNADVRYDKDNPAASKGWWRFDLVGEPDFCVFDASKLLEKMRSDEFSHIPWQQTFRCVGEVMKNSKGKLRTIEIITSDESHPQLRHFLMMLAALIENETSPDGVTYNTQWQAVNGTIEDNLRAGPFSDPCIVIRVRAKKGTNFEALRDLSKVLDECIGAYRRRSRNAEGIDVAPLLIDITGGQKTFSAAAAIKALGDDIQFAYVAHSKQKSFQVKAYDVVVERFAPKS